MALAAAARCLWWHWLSQALRQLWDAFEQGGLDVDASWRQWRDREQVGARGPGCECEAWPRMGQGIIPLPSGMEENELN